MLFVERGSASPLGVSLNATAINFAVFSRHATKASLLVYRNEEDVDPLYELHFDPHLNRTGDIWHMKVQGLQLPVYYHYRCGNEDNDQASGQRFNWENRLVDPYARALSAWGEWGDDPVKIPKAIFNPQPFDWQDDEPLDYHLKDSIIYETHIKGLSYLAGVQHPGTYTGVVEMIPYLKSLGITAVEFLPVFEFDTHENPFIDPTTGENLTNYWGYSTIAFFAPKASYACQPKAGSQVNEFKYMVRELHKAGIEVILDVVFNHSAEGNEEGKIYNFKGFDNEIYYILCEDKRYYRNYSGCGNTMNVNQPVVKAFVLDCLCYWVSHMHVDGFRFDLAAAMCRDGSGHLLSHPPLFYDISEDPVLSRTKMIVEPWDAQGGYLVGNFPFSSFSEWNDQFRDTVRAYWRNDPQKVGHFATVLMGSSDLYQAHDKNPYSSVNYVTCHDGFTLADLVSYQRKYNMRNSLDNKDGTDNHISWNCGVEGPSENKEILTLRNKQMKNFLLTVAIAQGVPMFNGGDEFARTQYGNNNTYCQDNEINWYNYQLAEKNAGLRRFFSRIIAMRKSSAAFQRGDFFTGYSDGSHPFPDVQWYNNAGDPFDWNSSENSLCCCIATTLAENEYETWLFFFNPSGKRVEFLIPVCLPGYTWSLKVDTAKESPLDIAENGHFYPLENVQSYLVESHSSVCLYMTKT